MQFEIDIASPPDAVFALLIDLRGYGRWLSASGLYADTLEISDNPVKLGTTYVDQGQSLPMRGSVTAFEPPSRLGFRQTGQVKLVIFRGDLEVDIQYTLEATPAGTHLTRKAALSTRRVPRLMENYIVRAMKKENPRILAKLKAYLEAQPG